MRAGLPQSTVKGLSGHSARVGAAQDMAAAGIDLIAIMQEGDGSRPKSSAGILKTWTYFVAAVIDWR